MKTAYDIYKGRKYEVLDDSRIYRAGTIITIREIDNFTINGKDRPRFVCTAELDGKQLLNSGGKSHLHYLDASEFISWVGIMTKELVTPRKSIIDENNHLREIAKVGACVHMDFLSNASDDDLRVYMNTFDDDMHHEEMKLFNEECDRRSAKAYGHKSDGEWL